MLIQLCVFFVKKCGPVACGQRVLVVIDVLQGAGSWPGILEDTVGEHPKALEL